MSESLAVAIAGVGAVADKHALALSELEHAELVAGSCRTKAKGEAFADEWDASWWDDTATMLDEVAPDVLIVCTPSGAHLEPTTAGLERDVHVLCEKPLEITTERIDRMIATAEESNGNLGGVFQQRFSNVLDPVAEAARSGRFGRLAVANAYVPWWRDDEYYANAWQGTRELDGGGALMNQSIHAIDAIQWLAGLAIGVDETENPVDQVQAYTGTLCHDDAEIEVEDTAVASVRYADGTLGQVLGSTAMYPGSRRRLQLAGRDGTAEIREDELAIWSFRDERPTDEEIREELGSADAGKGGAADPMAIDHAPHRRTIQAFLDSVTGGDPYPVAPREARKSVAIIEAIYDSARRNVPVSL